MVYHVQNIKVFQIVENQMKNILYHVSQHWLVLLVCLMSERTVPVRYNVKQKPRTVALEDLHMILDSQQSVIVINTVS